MENKAVFIADGFGNDRRGCGTRLEKNIDFGQYNRVIAAIDDH
jgi:hypothetical protein